MESYLMRQLNYIISIILFHVLIVSRRSFYMNLLDGFITRFYFGKALSSISKGCMYEVTGCCGPAEPSHFYSRASVARAGTPCSLHRTQRSRSRTPRVAGAAPPAPSRSSAGTQTPQEQLAPAPPHRASIPLGCHEVLPDGRIALGAPAVPQPRDTLPVVNDTPYCSDCNRYIM